MEINKNIYENIKTTIINARNKIYSTINFEMVLAYWNIGKQIVEAQGKEKRAEYGTGLITYLSERLTKEFGKGYNQSNLSRMRQFYLSFPILAALRQELSWTHYRLLLKIEGKEKLDFYLNECAEQNWSTRQLERQINSFYYERLLKTKEKYKKEVKDEIHKLVAYVCIWMKMYIRFWPRF